MGETISYLDLLKQKKFEEAFRLAEKDYVNNHSEYNLRNRASTLLCLKDYNAALVDYEEAQRISGGNSDSDYLSIGLISWIQNNRSGAIETWKAGLKTQYTDAAGGVRVPSFLFFASVITSDVRLEKEAIQYLRRRWKSNASINWPGAIAGYLLQAITDEDLLKSAEQISELRTRFLCQAYFYLAVNRIRENDSQGYLHFLKKCAASEMGYLEHEYYLAIGELDRLEV